MGNGRVARQAEKPPPPIQCPTLLHAREYSNVRRWNVGDGGGNKAKPKSESGSTEPDQRGQQAVMVDCSIDYYRRGWIYLCGPRARARTARTRTRLLVLLLSPRSFARIH